MNERKICERIAKILNTNYDCSKGIEELLNILEYELNEYKKNLEEQAIFMEAQLEELSRSYEEITTLLEISEILGVFEFPMNLQEKLEKVLPLLKNVIKFKTFLVRIEEEGLTMGNLRQEDIESELKERERTILIEPGKSEKFSNLLFVPIAGSRYYGYMCFSEKEEGIFTAGDRKIAEVTARYIANALDRVEFLKKEIERQRLEEQMEIARNIQSVLLPQKIPTTDFLEIASCSHPAVQVGGDYYDIFLTKGKLLAIIGDVAGKSVPAALLMSVLRSYLKVLTPSYSNLEELVNRLNNLLCEDMMNDRFVTMAFLEIFRDGRVSIINAGHNPIYFLRNGEIIGKIEASGIPMGISEWNYKKRIVHLRPNTFIITYTDGVTEARNEMSEEFGYERLEKVLRGYQGESSQELLNTLSREVRKFMGSASQHDDMTIMVLKYKGQQEVE
ncbi:PP2C family protein-serine/threonine phosphatase [Thermotoga sp. KOL6]|uniref:PP2C family protein-serine/threonine phosphatase n=1 Tax=Thermotoga sp. KOL6 TaxID=126741 RepID=UPI000C7807FC|nr:PP2C family protein-serine/threonine phosphatase [Thermotoga sp. KOL6]PLV59193.1 hypothetical protein AS005_05450 [Thermotoga sp. KOL6]